MLQKKWTDYAVKCACFCAITYTILYWVSNRRTPTIENQIMIYNMQGSNVKLPHAFMFYDGKWKLTDLCKPFKNFLNNSDYPLINYTTKAGTVQIFTHAMSDGISSIINRTGAFERETINRVLSELKRDPQLNLIDIGTNIGQHSISAALIGRVSIAIDAAKSNIQHVCASAHYLNMGQRITLIHNVISDAHGKRTFRYSANSDDFGSIHVDSDGIWEKMKKQYKNYFSNDTVEEFSATLDDILDLPQINQFRKVFVKIDVEGHEHRVLLGARKFFNHLDVHGVLMEWAWHVKRESAKMIKSVMMEMEFFPFEIIDYFEVPLPLDDSDSWPQDVLWLPKKFLSYK